MAPPLRLEVSLGADVALSTERGAAAVLSPDGTRMVFVGHEPGGLNRPYVREL